MMNNHSLLKNNQSFMSKVEEAEKEDTEDSQSMKKTGQDVNVKVLYLDSPMDVKGSKINTPVVQEGGGEFFTIKENFQEHENNSYEEDDLMKDTPVRVKRVSHTDKRPIISKNMDRRNT